MATSKKFNIAIVGGGLGGLALAIGLHRVGVPVHIYESAPEFAQIGAGMTFGDNAIKALGLIDPALLSGFRKHFRKNPEGFFMNVRFGMDVAHADGKLQDYKAGDLLYHQRDERESGFIHRARFLDEMVNLLPAGSASFSKTLVDISELPSGVELLFADGTSVTADAVIGCEGIKSVTRNIVTGTAIPPNFTGDYAYRQLVPSVEVIKELGEERALTSHLYLGYESLMCHYPVDGGATINFVAIHNSGLTTWPEGDMWLRPSTKEQMLKDLAGWDAPLLRLMSRLEEPQQWAIHDCGHDYKYYRNRICLLGDSAHASTPHLGAGAGMAMEDAYVLSKLIGRVDNAEDLPGAFETYDSVRRPHTQKLIASSRDSGKLWQLAFDGVKDDPVKLKEQLDYRFQWIWYHDLEAELDKAIANSVVQKS